MKKLRRSFIVLCSLAMLSSVTPAFAYNSSHSSSNVQSQELSEKQTITKEFINEVSPYVNLDEKTKQFSLSEKAKKDLDKDTYNKALEIINKSNAQISDIKEELVVSSKGTLIDKENESKMSAIDHDEYWDYDFTWWGLQIYWSHDFVEDLKDKIGLKTSVTVGTFIGTVQYLMEKHGKRPPSWFSAFTTAAAALTLWSFLEQDDGCGIYLDCYLYVPTYWYSACD
ncbi:hypothetical protein EEL31_18980 [Brevibacillus laterosporus]|nr:hypothetical protein [Brevibacillus laterosporus]TPG70371.1 hypothetical protein EEL31_18980 [Brevibacillus laterosporus]